MLVSDSVDSMVEGPPSAPLFRNNSIRTHTHTHTGVSSKSDPLKHVAFATNASHAGIRFFMFYMSGSLTMVGISFFVYFIFYGYFKHGPE